MSILSTAIEVATKKLEKATKDFEAKALKGHLTIQDYLEMHTLLEQQLCLLLPVTLKILGIPTSPSTTYDKFLGDGNE